MVPMANDVIPSERTARAWSEGFGRSTGRTNLAEPPAKTLQYFSRAAMKMRRL